MRRCASSLWVALAVAACHAEPAPAPPPGVIDAARVAQPAPPPPPDAAPTAPVARVEPPHLRNVFTAAGLQRFAATAARQANAFSDVVVLEASAEVPAVALTFDDGPDADGCPRVLDALAQARAPATFFVLGEAVAAQPGVLARMRREGHDVALHGWHHRSMRSLSPDRARRLHVDRAAAAVRRVLGDDARTDWLRPPYGDLSDAQIVALRAAGVRVPLWSIDSLDWQPGATSTSVVAEVTQHLHPGAIVLLHCGRGHGRIAAEALPAILAAMAARGLRPVTLSTLLGA